MFAQYYQNELNYLRTLGSEFAQRYPESAQFLHRDAKDPDVERLMQAFAFLAARLHERLDDQFSQVAEGFLSALWPQVLRPMPSFVMMQFEPDPHVLRTTLRLPRGVEMQSMPKSWGSYRFQLCRDQLIYPFRLVNARLTSEGDSTSLRLAFELTPGSNLKEIDLKHLDIHISDDDPTFTHGWYLWLTQYARAASLAVDGSAQSAPVSLSAVGFDDSTVLFPESRTNDVSNGDTSAIADEIPGHRLLREFLSFPEHFLFIRVNSLEPLRQLPEANRFELRIDLGTKLPTGSMRQITPSSFKLYCCPACNVFQTVSRIVVDHTRTEYVVRSDELDIENHEIYDILQVEGIERGIGARKVDFMPYFSRRIIEPEIKPYYRVRFADIHMKRNDRPLPGRECFLSVFDPEANPGDSASVEIAVRALCTQRGGAANIKLGEICQHTAAIPPHVRFSNISVPTAQRYPLQDSQNLWRLVATFSAGRKTLVDVANLKSLLNLYASRTDASDTVASRWLDSLSGIAATPGIMVEGGTVVRVLDITMDFDCEPLRNSQFYLFGAVLSEFMRKSATINSRLRFHIRFPRDGNRMFSWSQREGLCGIV